MKDIWISTENENKKYEFATLLEPLGFTIHTPKELVNFASVDETGTTFAENAILKAKALYDIVKQPVIADDSGLMVTALDGAPGVYSARYAGVDATDEMNRQHLLKNLAHIENRQASFISVIALVENNDTITTYEGTVSGTIINVARGENGFGYDCLFLSDELNKTFAEASITEKNTVSHRARAIQKLLQADFFKNN